MNAANMARTIVKMEPNTPRTLTLQNDSGVLAPSQDAGSPDQMQFTLADGSLIYLPLEVAAVMKELGGRNFVITKRVLEGQRRARWIVNRLGAFAHVQETTPTAPAIAPTLPKDPFRKFRSSPPALRPAVVTGPPTVPFPDWDAEPAVPLREAQPAADWEPPPSPPREKEAVPAEVPAMVVLPPSGMTAALIAAIDSCIEAAKYAATKGMTLKFSEEDIRTVAATIFLQTGRNP